MRKLAMKKIKYILKLRFKTENKIKTYNTTNAIDSGLFSPIKKLLKIHNGFTKSLKLKMVDDYLVSYKKKWLFRSPNFSLSRDDEGIVWEYIGWIIVDSSKKTKNINLNLDKIF